MSPVNKHSAEQFVRMLCHSGLVTAEQIAQARQSLSNEQSEDVSAIAEHLIGMDLLTRYQARQMGLGKTQKLFYGDYIILQPIGQGGMGTVYKARHRHMGRVVALKLLSSDIMKTQIAKGRFYREIKVAAQLIHPNIVTAFDASEDHGEHYLIMEYVDGRDLSQIVKESGPLSISGAIDVIRQAASGLAYAHQHNIIHRDIKPSNLLRASDGQIKILDMGLARFNDETEGTDDLTLTRSGQLMGTVAYMAPEQASNPREADHRSDIYSLGCTFYQLMVGQSPFTGSTVVQVIVASREQPTPDLRPRFESLLLERHPGLDRVQGVLELMMAKQPEHRYQSMSQVIADMDRLEACLPEPIKNLRLPASPMMLPVSDLDETLESGHPGVQHVVQSTGPRSAFNAVFSASPQGQADASAEAMVGGIPGGAFDGGMGVSARAGGTSGHARTGIPRWMIGAAAALGAIFLTLILILTWPKAISSADSPPQVATRTQLAARPETPASPMRSQAASVEAQPRLVPHAVISHATKHPASSSSSSSSSSPSPSPSPSSAAASSSAHQPSAERVTPRFPPSTFGHSQDASSSPRIKEPVTSVSHGATESPKNQTTHRGSSLASALLPPLRNQHEVEDLLETLVLNRRSMPIGKWDWTGVNLISAKGKVSMLLIRKPLPPEYQVDIVFRPDQVRADEEGVVLFRLPHMWREITVALDRTAGSEATGFYSTLTSDATPDASGTSASSQWSQVLAHYNGQLLEPGQTYHLQVTSEGETMAVRFNEKLILTWSMKRNDRPPRGDRPEHRYMTFKVSGSTQLNRFDLTEIRNIRHPFGEGGRYDRRPERDRFRKPNRNR